MEMEARVNQEMSTRYRNSVISNGNSGGGAFQPTGADPGPSSAFTQPVRPCTVDDLNEISRTTLLLMVEWAKNLAPFPDLSMEDKIILLKNYAPQHLILMPAFRSPDSKSNLYSGLIADKDSLMKDFIFKIAREKITRLSLTNIDF